MTQIHNCHYCHGVVHVGCVQLQGVGIFCDRACARIYLTLNPSREIAFQPENVCGFRNPPLRYEVMAIVRAADGLENVRIGESRDYGHAARMASAYPHRAVVVEGSRQRFDNLKQIVASEAA